MPNLTQRFLRWIIPNATVFLASLCIMVLELTAGRLVSRYLGQSLYTWTSVIGIVLAGISLGNSLGGRVADRFDARRSLCVLFILASMTCFLVPAVNYGMGQWPFMWELSWPMRIVLHVFLTFMLPSTILGMISPVVAKMALAMQTHVGRTIGNVYAWGAAGSIVGTFLAGYYLIAAMGTIAVVLTVGIVLAVMGLLYGLRFWVAYIWTAIVLMVCVVAFGPGDAVAHLARAACLREKMDESILYSTESQYQYIAVKSRDGDHKVRGIYLDKMLHSEMDITQPTNLLYKYSWIYEAILDKYSKPGQPVSAFVIGGGGYTFPQYLALTRPGSQVDVSEIDPAVTEAAFAACGYSNHPSVSIFNIDARNFVADRIRAKEKGRDYPAYDYIFGDTFNDYSVPYHLTTKEFNEHLNSLLKTRGMYLLNMIDSFNSGRFLSSIIKTFRETFPSVHVFYCHRNMAARGTYVVVCSKFPVDLSDIDEMVRLRHPEYYGHLLTDAEMDLLAQRGDPVLLTDDYAPVENLMAAVVRKDRPDDLDEHYLREGLRLAREGELDGAILQLQQAVEFDMGNSYAFYNLGVAYMQKGQMREALGAFQMALQNKPDYTEARANAGVIMAQTGRIDDALNQFRMILDYEPDNAQAYVNLASLLVAKGQMSAARSELLKAMEINPSSGLIWNSMGELLLLEGKSDEARTSFLKALKLEPQLKQAQINLARMRGISD